MPPKRNRPNNKMAPQLTPEQEMQNYFEVKSWNVKAAVRARMEARREAQSEAWEAICRIAGKEIDFEVDDLVALEKRAQAELNRTKVVVQRF